ncbi:hypothetical protein AYI70_g6648 [Smittium culicis]|nr:hypothetical protein AYI70_g6648 [Smittium culicis]
MYFYLPREYRWTSPSYNEIIELLTKSGGIIASQKQYADFLNNNRIKKAVTKDAKSPKSHDISIIVLSPNKKPVNLFNYKDDISLEKFNNRSDREASGIHVISKLVNYNKNSILDSFKKFQIMLRYSQDTDLNFYYMNSSSFLQKKNHDFYINHSLLYNFGDKVQNLKYSPKIADKSKNFIPQNYDSNFHKLTNNSETEKPISNSENFHEKGNGVIVQEPRTQVSFIWVFDCIDKFDLINDLFEYYVFD